MTDTPQEALQYARDNQTRFIDELKELVRIPSISTDPEARDDMLRAAEWLAAHLRQLNCQDVQIIPTPGHPMVYGEWLEAGPDKPVALVYGHYDVQPAEPLEEWVSPPFEPEVRGKSLYGRGATDMKGQIIIVLKAIESLMKTSGMPVNLKFIFEGEEEIGSPNMARIIEEYRNLLACDFTVNPDSGMMAADIPTITYGLRGLAYFDIVITGPSQDLHSGLYGGAVHNPAQVLCELIAGMHDEKGRITLPGFYDKVRPLDENERLEMKRLPISDQDILRQTGAPALRPEEGYTAVEAVTGRPTLEVNGLLSGYTGEGSKTVLPARALAKVSMRLVPDQSPQEDRQQLEQYLEKHCPPTVRWEVRQHAGGPASITDINIPAVKAMAEALERVWGKRPVFKREGGSITAVADIQRLLGAESVLTGFALPEDNMHSPNEKIDLLSFERGIDAMIHFFSILGQPAG